MTSVLVTGAAGFVGSHFARVAHDAGLSVVAIDDLSTSTSWPQLPEDIERIVGDVADRTLVTKIVTGRSVDAIVHFAGRIRVDESMREPALYFEQNVARTAVLLDAATLAVSRPPCVRPVVERRGVRSAGALTDRREFASASDQSVRLKQALR